MKDAISRLGPQEGFLRLNPFQDFTLIVLVSKEVLVEVKFTCAGGVLPHRLP